MQAKHAPGLSLSQKPVGEGYGIKPVPILLTMGESDEWGTMGEVDFRTWGYWNKCKAMRVEPCGINSTNETTTVTTTSTTSTVSIPDNSTNDTTTTTTSTAYTVTTPASTSSITCPDSSAPFIATADGKTLMTDVFATSSPHLSYTVTTYTDCDTSKHGATLGGPGRANPLLQTKWVSIANMNHETNVRTGEIHWEFLKQYRRWDLDSRAGLPGQGIPKAVPDPFYGWGTAASKVGGGAREFSGLGSSLVSLIAVFAVLV